MILSKKSRYGLRALIDLAVHSGNSHMALNVLAERGGISPQYLEQVFAALRRADIVRSIKGPSGGYLLKRPAADITVEDIVLALDGSFAVEEEVSPDGCSVHGITETIQRRVVDPVNEHLSEALRSVTLADLVEDYDRNASEAMDMYYI